MKKKLLILPWLLYSGLIFIASSYQLKGLPKMTILGWDKLVHMAEYTVYSILAGIALLSFDRKKYSFNLILIAFLITILFGASDEIHQYFVPGRSCSIYDFVADCLGAILGLILFQKLKIVNKLQHVNTGKTDSQ